MHTVTAMARNLIPASLNPFKKLAPLMRLALLTLAIAAPVSGAHAAESTTGSSAPQNFLPIASAGYGVVKDVTSVVSAQVKDGTLKIAAENNTLGGDPLPGVVKTLTIRYVSGGYQRIGQFEEHSEARLPVNGTADSSLKVLEATWGLEKDVTAVVSANVRDRALSILVDNDVLGGDPIPGVIKTLRVRYSLDGIEGRASAKEQQVLSISMPTLHIRSAVYGASGGFSDVTARVQAKIVDGKLKLQVTNETMGGDPKSGVVKALSIHYYYQGRLYSASTPETQTVTLPQ